MAQVLLGISLAMAGCATQPEVRSEEETRPAPPAALDAGPALGGEWQAVLAAPVVAGLVGAEGEAGGWPDSRRDESLSPRPVEPLLASNAWPEPRRPSLGRPEYVRVPRSPESFIIYRTERGHEFYRGRGDARGGWYRGPLYQGGWYRGGWYEGGWQHGAPLPRRW